MPALHDVKKVDIGPLYTGVKNVDIGPFYTGIKKM